MKIADLITWFEEWANPAWCESWDNCGWQIQPGVLEQKARVLVCLTPTLAVMHEAIALNANLIFAHHPLIFNPLKSLSTGEAIADMAKLAFTHNIGIYSAHTNFDQVQDGTADVLAQILNLKETTPIVPTQGGLGYGRVGLLEPFLTLQELLATIQTRLAAPQLIFSPTADLQQRISRVAVLGGSGAGYISEVVKTHAQAYLTSDCKFHQFQESRDRHLILIDAGHYATERPACDRLVQRFISLNLDWVKLSHKDEDFRQFFP
ncbi:Nif3-like dinuclear metal center hexameric protein [Nodularia sphaerocarpa]|uniref:Nif3-like dinuclear metal center hexameric protein n=1 Tax=Nodularia sphaerocarpa TaxID=137816 RepID=UPI001EFBE17F|nr:Nif3-like dinuclear metal center hexameric protein [Nodularia sphaerocarpa]MDB9375376.1 Nif3-like dinuclear metal center hexameric protein [Nodularia sphaerocarpa CS-585]MDB9377653.1 Nif3-like dinuclear metal center hexameric protein [Nodularia sphaerocarpa CS-585A2]ULP70795.1 GTP cyclohydrolase 1 type 2 [Nodularia sphaerocarpa UHCC 0038]